MALSRENFKYIIVGCVVVIVGFILMSGGGTEDPTQFNEEELFSFRRITLAPFCRGNIFHFKPNPFPP